jgi:DNA-binding transcriptional LysR family regulator
MFEKLFTDAGLSLDRLRALVEVGATGSIVQAAAGDPIKQSQYSRQIKELESFFQTRLVERHGKGIRLTPGGKELARISRFFLLGLSNFHRGCHAEEQTFRIGASATFIECFLLPLLAKPTTTAGPRHVVEVVEDTEIERRLHDLTLDFGIISAAAISRPLQMKLIGAWRPGLWVPKAVCKNQAQAVEALKGKRLPLALPSREFSLTGLDCLNGGEPRLICGSFLETKSALQREGLAAVLPDFLATDLTEDGFHRVRLPALDACEFQYRLAWNPRLLRLNPHASCRRDLLAGSLAAQMRGQRSAVRSLSTGR